MKLSVRIAGLDARIGRREATRLEEDARRPPRPRESASSVDPAASTKER